MYYPTVTTYCHARDTYCEMCGHPEYIDDHESCEVCCAVMCPDCVRTHTCTECGGACCDDCITRCDQCGALLCPACKDSSELVCAECGLHMCAECAETDACDECDAILCEECCDHPHTAHAVHAETAEAA